MAAERELKSLEQLVDRLEESAQGDGRVSLGSVLETVGTTSFGPFLLLAGILTLMPIVSGIPGVPTVGAILVFVTAGQILLHRKHVWLPGWLLRRSLPKSKLRRAIGWVRPPARSVDRFIKPRLKRMTGKVAMHVMAAVCLLVSLCMPLMELVPFSANGAGVAFIAFGLSLIGRDGLLAIVAFASTGFTFGFVAVVLLWGT